MGSLRRTDRALELEESRQLLENAPVGRLATTGADGPYIIPLSFAYAGSDTIYFHCASTGHKLENLDGDPRVCFEVDEMLAIVPAARACGFGLSYRSVVAFGLARRVSERAEKDTALRLLMEKYVGPVYPPLPEDDNDSVVVVAVDIDHMTGKGRSNELSDAKQL
jgi:uncharacterized protein